MPKNGYFNLNINLILENQNLQALKGGFSNILKLNVYLLMPFMGLCLK